jgi:hemoglobin-like flavoprotein
VCERAASVRARRSRAQVTENSRQNAVCALRYAETMPLDPAILRSSFELVIDRRPDLTLRFYEILFERYPELSPLFSRDRTAQSKMLAQALAAVLDHLEDAPWLAQTLGALGAKHVGYGVTDAMYDQVGDALLATLAEVAAEAWTDEVRGQWTLAFGAIATLMQAGARTVDQAHVEQPRA